MAFDFLGSFANEQLDELEAFLLLRIKDFDLEANHFVKEANRYRNLRYKYETALTNLGGSTLYWRYEKVFDEEIQTSIPTLFETAIFEQSMLKIPNRSPITLNDSDVATLTSRLKKPFIREIKYLIERLERKIRKCADYVDQLEEQRFFKLLAKTETENILKSIRIAKSSLEAATTSNDLSDPGNTTFIEDIGEE